MEGALVGNPSVAERAGRNDRLLLPNGGVDSPDTAQFLQPPHHP
jgi:hypothetical protein